MCAQHSMPPQTHIQQHTRKNYALQCKQPSTNKHWYVLHEEQVIKNIIAQSSCHNAATTLRPKITQTSV